MKAMILAAGRGERMRPLTDHTPKPLLPVAGKPLIEHQIERIAQAGIQEIVINHAHLGGMIESHLGGGARWGVSIQYSPEKPALETGGGIFNALPLLGEEPFLVVNGDVWCDIEFSHLRLRKGMLAHLVLVNNPAHHPEGDFSLHDGLLMEGGASQLTYSGVGLYQAKLFAGCKPGRFPLSPLLRRAIQKSRITGEHHVGVWIDVGTPGRLAELENFLTV